MTYVRQKIKLTLARRQLGTKGRIARSTIKVESGWKTKTRYLSIAYLKKISHGEKEGSAGLGLQGLMTELKTLKKEPAASGCG